MKYCQGTRCHEYKTKDRIRGMKGDKHYETRKNSRGFGNRQKDNRPFLHYYDLDKKGYRYATNWEIL